MKNVKTFILFLVAFSAFTLSAQDFSKMNELNAYRFAEIDPPTKGTTQDNITKEDLRLTNLIERLLSEKGFVVIPRDDSGRTPTYGGKLEMPVESYLVLGIFSGRSLQSNTEDHGRELQRRGCFSE